MSIMIIGVGLLLFISLITAFTFKLNKETHGVLVEEIERLKNNGLKKDVDPKTKKVVESLTGYSYEKLWGGKTDKAFTQVKMN